ncbi:MAG: glycine oxidase [Thermoleophilaceae bacterium]|jgi:glycine oxidase|nr:glycine oxidase [Thermoleophilaceae bacterium]
MSAPRSGAYDAVVVGGGVIGLASAWRAAQRGLRVLVIERDEPGAGASGVAAGMLAPVTEAEFGEERLLRLNLESAALWPDFAAELEERSGIDTGFRSSGALVAAADRDDGEELRRLFGFQRELGLAVEWLGSRDARRLEPRLSPRVSGAILAPEDAQVEPRAVVRALVAALEREGGELLRARAGAVAPDSVTLADGTRVRAAHVVVAAGCWSGAFDGAPAVRPVKGQILRMRGAEPLTERLVRTPRCYVVSRPNGEVVVGATVEERGFDTTVTAGGVHRLLEAAWEVLPEIEELELVEAAARLRPATPDNAPVIAERDGVIWATGHYRNGVLLAPITADLVSGIMARTPAGVA